VQRGEDRLHGAVAAADDETFDTLLREGGQPPADLRLRASDRSQEIRGGTARRRERKPTLVAAASGILEEADAKRTSGEEAHDVTPP
jgi:hypothetical protein